MKGIDNMNWRCHGQPVSGMTSSREERDLAECYRLGGNACIVKPVRFPAFVEADKQIGMFWALLNEPLPGSMIQNEQREGGIKT